VIARDPQAAQTDRLLRLRQGRVEAARDSLAEAAAEASSLERQIDQALQAMAEHNAVACEALLQKASPSSLGIYRRCVDDLQGVVATHRQWLVEAQRKVARRRAELAGLLADLKAARAVWRRRETQRDRLARRAETREHDDLHTARESIRRVERGA